MEYTADRFVCVDSINAILGFWLVYSSGYRNEIVIHGPVEERARLVHDWIAALQHNPWEFAHRASAKKTLKQQSLP